MQLLVNRSLSQASLCATFCQKTTCHLYDIHCKHRVQGSGCLRMPGSLWQELKKKKTNPAKLDSACRNGYGFQRFIFNSLSISGYGKLE